MKIRLFLGAICFLTIFTSVAWSASHTQVNYSLDNLGPNHWKYTYEVINLTLPVPIEEFTIWFDYGLYDNLTIETPNPPASNWDEITVQPEPVLGDNGFYDTLALGSGIAIGQTVPGFSVSFDWLGTGTPGSQFYEIVEPVTFEIIDSGFTVPEPTTCLIVITGLVLLSKVKK